MTVDLIKPPAPNGAKNSDSEGDDDEEEPIVSDNDTPTLQDLSCKIHHRESAFQNCKAKFTFILKANRYLDSSG